MGVNKVVYDGKTLMDLTSDTVTPDTLAEGVTAHDASGKLITGTFSILKAYPVGAVYISVSSTDPGTLFGGKWEQIKDRFLLSAGDKYTAGSIGGEAKHKLTVDEMPRHSHGNGNDEGFNFVGGGLPYAGEGGATTTGTAGGDQPHNNMPPYLSVYMWKRTS